MPRAGLTPDRVVLLAADLADEVGLDELTLARIADRLGVRTPSLYKHVRGLPALRREIAVLAKRELSEVLGRAAAGQAQGDALRAVADAYRTWAREKPGRYAASQRAPHPGDAVDLAASEAAATVVFNALRGYGLDDDRQIDAVRTVRALVHGYVTLECSGGFGLPRDVDASLAWALDTLDAALTIARE